MLSTSPAAASTAPPESLERSVSELDPWEELAQAYPALSAWNFYRPHPTPLEVEVASAYARLRHRYAPLAYERWVSSRPLQALRRGKSFEVTRASYTVATPLGSVVEVKASGSVEALKGEARRYRPGVTVSTTTYSSPQAYLTGVTLGPVAVPLAVEGVLQRRAFYGDLVLTYDPLSPASVSAKAQELLKLVRPLLLAREAAEAEARGSLPLGEHPGALEKTPGGSHDH